MNRSEDIGLFMEYSRLDETQFLFIMSLLRNCLQCLVYAQRLTFANVISYSGDRARSFALVSCTSEGVSWTQYFFFRKRSSHQKTVKPHQRSSHTHGRANPFWQHGYQNGHATYSCAVSFSFTEKQNGFNKRLYLRITSFSEG